MQDNPYRAMLLYHVPCQDTVNDTHKKICKGCGLHHILDKVRSNKQKVICMLDLAKCLANTIISCNTT